MNITITPATEADLPALLSLARTAAKTPGSHWDETYPNEEILRWDLAGQGLYRIEADGVLAGLISMCRDEDDELHWPTRDENAHMLSRLGFAPEFQGKGLVYPAVTKTVEHGRALGVRTFRLLVATDLPRLIRVYERCGFTRTGRVFHYGDDYYQYELTFA